MPFDYNLFKYMNFAEFFNLIHSNTFESRIVKSISKIHTIYDQRFVWWFLNFLSCLWWSTLVAICSWFWHQFWLGSRHHSLLARTVGSLPGSGGVLASDAVCSIESSVEFLLVTAAHDPVSLVTVPTFVRWFTWKLEV